MTQIVQDPKPKRKRAVAKQKPSTGKTVHLFIASIVMSALNLIALKFGLPSFN